MTFVNPKLLKAIFIIFLLLHKWFLKATIYGFRFFSFPLFQRVVQRLTAANITKSVKQSVDPR